MGRLDETGKTRLFMGKLSGQYENIYSVVSSFKLIRSSNMEAKNEQRKVPFRKLPFCKVDKARLHFILFFFANFSVQCNAMRRQLEIILFSIP